MNSTELKERLDHLAELKDTARRLKRESDQARDEMKRYEADLWQDMNEHGFRSFGTDRGRYDRKSTPFGVITDRQAFVEWCHQNGVEDIIQETEISQRLNELVRSRLDSQEELPPGTSFYTRDYISLTKR